MAQRDKVKELVGRGLNSYHTKALQQVDRIEKKNKEQNHKISILSNELDNDYLTKTEEGSVISLEHSKEGMVYLDELQGNTLVNYCTDGSKEMTLNGDIDIEGTFVTTTEGVDDGKVDVMCEGNTLVNCIKDASIKDVELIATTNGGFVQSPFYALDKFLFKPNTVYTFVALLKENTINNSVQLCCSHSRTAIKTTTTIKTPLPNTIVFTFTTKEDFTGVDLGLYHQLSGCTSGKLSFTQMILEGDWTNKEIPPYFEGMKSVGQDDENGHKIEILSHNKFLGMNDDNITLRSSSSRQGFNKFTIIGSESWNSEVHFNVNSSDVPIGTNIKIRIKVLENTNPSMNNSSLKSWQLTDFNIGNFDYSLLNEWQEIEYNVNKEYTGSANSKLNLMIFGLKNTALPTDRMVAEIEVEINNSKKSNKKEISLNEPLRGIGDNKDKFIKQGGKWYINRLNKEVVFNGSENWLISRFNSNEEEGYIGFELSNLGIKISNRLNIISDRFVTKETINNSGQGEGIQGSTSIDIVWIKILKSKLTTQDVDGFKQWLQSNPVKVVYQLATPIYEPLEVEPTLNTYNDITHISNNSIIPCTMKIKNSGYNAIIKPSTLYTVALDTNKNGTIGLNLGGAKVTTTNNVATITTPATLSDDSLRPYGKGIKSSKVRLLEGDKTNWIPSHFEGMKSSFEDKLQEDGSYKMEILMNNKNLLDVEENLTFDRKTILINLKKGKYIVSYKSISGHLNGRDSTMAFYNGDKEICHFTITNGKTFDLNFDCDRVHLYSNGYNWVGSQDLFVTVNTLQLAKGNVVLDAELQKSNKIQFSSIEPLRGVGDVKDRVYIKDDKVVVQRNCGSVTLDGSDDEGWSKEGTYSNGITPFYLQNNSMKKLPTYINAILCNKLKVVAGHQTFPLDNCISGYSNVNKYPNENWIYIFIKVDTIDDLKQWLQQNPVTVVYQLAEPTYEEIPFELQKIILEGYENGTLFFDTNIPPTATVTYAGETPIAKATKLNKTEVLNNTEDINDNIIPYLMDMDYRVVMLQLATEELEGGVSMARLFGGTYEMIKRDILSKRLTREEYGYRLADYFNAGKLTEEQVRELEDLR